MKEADFNFVIERLYHHPVIMEYIINQVEKDKEKVNIINRKLYVKLLKSFTPSFLYTTIVLSTNFLSFMSLDVLAFMVNVLLFMGVSLWQMSSFSPVLSAVKEEFSVELEEGTKIVSGGTLLGGRFLSKESLKQKIENVDNEVVKNKVSFNK